MSGNSVLLDTNIVLYLLSGDKVLADLLFDKKPDSIVLATAQFLNTPVITSDDDFKITGSTEVIIYS